MRLSTYLMIKSALDSATLEKYKDVMNPGLYDRVEKYVKDIPEGVTAGQHIKHMSPYEKAKLINETHRSLNQNNLMHSSMAGYHNITTDPSEAGVPYLKRYAKRFDPLDPNLSLIDSRYLMTGRPTSTGISVSRPVIAPNHAFNIVNSATHEQHNPALTLSKRYIKQIHRKYPNIPYKTLLKHFRH